MGTTAYGGKESKGRAANGDRPIGAASCRREQHTQGDMSTPPPLPAPKVVSWGACRKFLAVGQPYSAAAVTRYLYHNLRG